MESDLQFPQRHVVPFQEVIPQTLELRQLSSLYLPSTEIRELSLDASRPTSAVSIPVSLGLLYASASSKAVEPQSRRQLADARTLRGGDLSLRREASAAHVGCRTFHPSRYVSSARSLSHQRKSTRRPAMRSTSLHPTTTVDPSLPFFPRNVDRSYTSENTLALRHSEQRKKGSFTNPPIGHAEFASSEDFQDSKWWKECAQQPTARRRKSLRQTDY